VNLHIPTHLASLRVALERLGGEITVFAVEPPAAAAAVDAVEAQIGRPLPQRLRHFFMEQTAGVDILWSLDDRDFSGSFDLRLSALAEEWDGWRSGWREAFEHPAAHGWPAEANLQAFDAAFPLLSLMNGDQLILFDDDPGDPGEVMYLSHEAADGDLVVLGTSLDRFFETWVRLACAGPEFDELVDFYDFDAQEISLETEESREWVTLLERASSS